MERRTFLSSVAAAACASSVGVERVRGQTESEEDESGGWTLLPYDEKRRRVNPDGAGLPEGLAGVEEVWKFDAEGATRPVVSGGTAYIGTHDGVTAVDTLTGEEVWSYETEGEVRQSPAFYDGTVYAGTSEGSMVAVNSRNGEEVWSVGLDGTVTTSPMVAGVDLFVGTERENILYCLDISDGEEKWSYATRVSPVVPPAVMEERVIYVDGALVFALNRFDGEEEWHTHNGGTLSEVVIGETRAYTIDGGTIYAQRLSNGVERWSKTVRGEIVGGAVLQGTTMHVATDSGFMYSLDLNSDGWTEWKKEFTGGFIGSPVLVDGVLYGVTLEGEEGRLYAVDPSNGETLGEYIIGNEQVEQDGDDEIEGMDVELTDGPTVTGANAYVVGEEGLRAFGDEEEVPPTASFEVSPSSPDPGDTVTFDASGSSSGSAPIDTYEWRFSSDAEEFSGAGETYEEDFEEERNWTVSVTVTDEDGLSDTATKEMSVGGSASEGTEETVESANETVPTKPSPEPGFLGGVSDTVFLALGALGAVVSALGFSAYWRMEPEREKLRRRNKNGGLCHDCGASVKPDEDACGVCGSKLSHRDQE
ncbi:MAG: PQQ-binding-like beta-propeller repeat protein [Halobacteriales archaeon]